MANRPGAMHVARISSGHVDKSGQRRVYRSVYLRRSFRDGGKVKHEQLANLSMLPAEAIDAIEATLKGKRLVPVQEAFTITRCLPHGHVAAGAAMRPPLSLPPLLGPSCAQRAPV